MALQSWQQWPKEEEESFVPPLQPALPASVGAAALHSTWHRSPVKQTGQESWGARLALLGRGLGTAQDFHLCSYNVTQGGNPGGCSSLNNSTTHSLLSMPAWGPSRSAAVCQHQGAGCSLFCVPWDEAAVAERGQTLSGGICGLRGSVLLVVCAEHLSLPGGAHKAQLSRVPVPWSKPEKGKNNLGCCFKNCFLESFFLLQQQRHLPNQEENTALLGFWFDKKGPGQWKEEKQLSLPASYLGTSCWWKLELTGAEGQASARRASSRNFLKNPTDSRPVFEASISPSIHNPAQEASGVALSAVGIWT